MPTWDAPQQSLGHGVRGSRDHGCARNRAPVSGKLGKMESDWTIKQPYGNRIHFATVQVGYGVCTSADVVSRTLKGVKKASIMLLNACSLEECYNRCYSTEYGVLRSYKGEPNSNRSLSWSSKKEQEDGPLFGGLYEYSNPGQNIDAENSGKTN